MHDWSIISWAIISLIWDGIIDSRIFNYESLLCTLSEQSLIARSNIIFAFLNYSMSKNEIWPWKLWEIFCARDYSGSFLLLPWEDEKNAHKYRIILTIVSSAGKVLYASFNLQTKWKKKCFRLQKEQTFDFFCSVRYLRKLVDNIN